MVYQKKKTCGCWRRYKLKANHHKAWCSLSFPLESKRQMERKKKSEKHENNSNLTDRGKKENQLSQRLSPQKHFCKVLSSIQVEIKGKAFHRVCYAPTSWKFIFLMAGLSKTNDLLSNIKTKRWKKEEKGKTFITKQFGAAALFCCLPVRKHYSPAKTSRWADESVFFQGGGAALQPESKHSCRGPYVLYISGTSPKNKLWSFYQDSDKQ